MSVTILTNYLSPNYSSRYGRPIRAICLHTTQGTDSRGWLTSAASGVSAHYLIQHSDIYRLVSEDDAAWHAGIIVGTPTTPLYDGTNPNEWTIGIEMEGFADALLDPETIASAVALIRDIRERRGPLPLCSHSELSPGNRSDPGAQNRAAIEAALEWSDDMTPAQEAKLDRVLAILEAREPLVWTARVQRDLDVETGKAFDTASVAHDPRIKT